MSSLQVRSKSAITFKCKWGECEVDLTNSKQSFYDHIRKAHIDGFEPVYTCEWTSCPKGIFVFQSQDTLMLHIQSEHTKKKYFRCSQPTCDLYFQDDAALNRHRLRDHKQSLTQASSIISRSSFYDPTLTRPETRRRVMSLTISDRNPEMGTSEASAPLKNHTLSQTVPEKIIEKLFFITPRLPILAKCNPFAYAQLNDLSGKIYKQNIVGGGSYADVYAGYWATEKHPTKVAVKVLRSHIYKEATIPKLEKRLRREMRIWGKLDHPNIVSLLGVTSSFGKYTAMVCQWMSQGTLSEYLKEKRDNLNLQGRLNICIAVAHGLSYLHSQKIIHGDLAPSNILMDGDVPHLNDFGLSNVITEYQGPSFLTSKVTGAVRWIAPELLLVFSGITPEVTIPCDVYSFASIALFVVTEVLPYEHLKNDIAVMAEILKSKGKSPSRPAHSLLTDESWQILTMCWSIDPTKRPAMNTLTERLQQLSLS